MQEFHRDLCPNRAHELPNRCIENTQYETPAHRQLHTHEFDIVVVVAVVPAAVVVVLVVVVIVVVLVLVLLAVVVVLVVVVDGLVHLSMRRDTN